MSANSHLIAFRVTTEQLDLLVRTALTAGEKPSGMARKLMLSALKPPCWTAEWKRMDGMNKQRAWDRFEKLRDGRPLPAEFGSWSRAQRVEWLDKEWPLG